MGKKTSKIGIVPYLSQVRSNFHQGFSILNDLQDNIRLLLLLDVVKLYLNLFWRLLEEELVG
jgi:hypothetical protein